MAEKVAVIHKEYEKLLRDAEKLHTDVVTGCKRLSGKIGLLVAPFGPFKATSVSENASALSKSIDTNLFSQMDTMYKALEQMAADYGLMIDNIDNS